MVFQNFKYLHVFKVTIYKKSIGKIVTPNLINSNKNVLIFFILELTSQLGVLNFQEGAIWFALRLRKFSQMFLQSLDAISIQNLYQQRRTYLNDDKNFVRLSRTQRATFAIGVVRESQQVRHETPWERVWTWLNLYAGNIMLASEVADRRTKSS